MNQTKAMTIPVEMQLSMMPNYIRFLVVDTTVSMYAGELTDKQVAEFCKAWTKAFVVHCKEKRIGNTGPKQSAKRKMK